MVKYEQFEHLVEQAAYFNDNQEIRGARKLADHCEFYAIDSAWRMVEDLINREPAERHGIQFAPDSEEYTKTLIFPSGRQLEQYLSAESFPGNEIYLYTVTKKLEADQSTLDAVVDEMDSLRTQDLI